MNIDPKGEKYLNLSPYVYVADNPMTNVDPDGKDIIFIVGNANPETARNFVYRKGNFYDVKTNERYNPAKSVSPTMYKVLTAYRKIESSGNKTLTNVLHKLEKSDKHHYVVDNGTDNVTHAYGIPDSVDKNGKAQGRIGSMTEFDFSKEQMEYSESAGVTFTVFNTVVHEMAHAYNLDIDNQSDDTGEHNQDNPEEQRAVFFENLARQIENQLKRHKYGGEIPKKYLKDPPNNKFDK